LFLARSSASVIRLFSLLRSRHRRHLHSFPTRRSSDLPRAARRAPSEYRSQTSRHVWKCPAGSSLRTPACPHRTTRPSRRPCRRRSEEHTSELQSRENLVCRLLLEKKKNKIHHAATQ